MERRPLGTTGVSVSSLCLGTFMFGSAGNDDASQCERMVQMALEGGIDFIDTAARYSDGFAEEVVGRAVDGCRDDVFIATKYSPMGERGNSRRSIRSALEQSLRRLRTDYVDLYQIHRPHMGTDIVETLSALTDLRSEGKILYAGCSTFPAWQLVEAQVAAERHGLARFVCEEPPYSILVRAVERDVFPVAERYGIGIMVWGPLAGGWLTGKYRRDTAPEPGTRAARLDDYRRLAPRMEERFDLAHADNQRKFDAVEALTTIAEGAGIELAHLALAFTLAHPAVDASIVGPRTPEQLAQILAGADIRLGSDVLEAIDRVVRPGGYVNDADLGWEMPWMSPPARRRSTVAS
jgi:aryl-alcohol dehydrogenase (NADP+)